jgi:hypothetical protein
VPGGLQTQTQPQQPRPGTVGEAISKQLQPAPGGLQTQTQPQQPRPGTIGEAISKQLQQAPGGMQTQTQPQQPRPGTIGEAISKQLQPAQQSELQQQMTNAGVPVGDMTAEAWRSIQQEQVECTCRIEEISHKLKAAAPLASGGAVSSAAASILETTSPCIGGTIADGTCRCTRGEVAKRFSDRTVCMPELSSPGTGGGSAPKVAVPTTPTTGVLQPLPPHCTGGRIGAPPNCHCPEGTQWTGRACLQLAVNPPVDPCQPGFVSFLGRCVRIGLSEPTRIDPKPSRPPLSGGGTDGTAKVGGPAPTPLSPSTAGAPVPSTGVSGGVLKPGPSGAAQALRCQPPRVMINRVCACPGGTSGVNCEKPYLR